MAGGRECLLPHWSPARADSRAKMNLRLVSERAGMSLILQSYNEGTCLRRGNLGLLSLLRGLCWGIKLIQSHRSDEGYGARWWAT